MGRGELWRGRDLIRLTATESMLMRLLAARAARAGHPPGAGRGPRRRHRRGAGARRRRADHPAPPQDRARPEDPALPADGARLGLHAGAGLTTARRRLKVGATLTRDMLGDPRRLPGDRVDRAGLARRGEVQPGEVEPRDRRRRRPGEPADRARRAPRERRTQPKSPSKPGAPDHRPRCRWPRIERADRRVAAGARRRSRPDRAPPRARRCRPRRCTRRYGADRGGGLVGEADVLLAGRRRSAAGRPRRRRTGRAARPLARSATAG